MIIRVERDFSWRKKAKEIELEDGVYLGYIAGENIEYTSLDGKRRGSLNLDWLKEGKGYLLLVIREDRKPLVVYLGEDVMLECPRRKIDGETLIDILRDMGARVRLDKITLKKALYGYLKTQIRKIMREAGFGSQEIERGLEEFVPQ